MPAARAQKKPPRQRWLFTFFLFTALVFLSIYSMSNPLMDKEKQFADAEEVPISRITKGYAEQEL